MPVPQLIPANPITHSVQSVYRSVFVKITTRAWFQDVLNFEEVIPVLREVLQHLKVDPQSLNARIHTIAASLDSMDRPVDYFDMVRFLRHYFYGVPGNPASLVVRTIMQRLHDAWPLAMTPETLRLAKGISQHMADGVEPKNISEYELACLCLRPVMEPGLVVVHSTTDQVGTVLDCGPEEITWRPFSKKQPETESDIYTIIPLVPLMSGLPLDFGARFPKIPAAAIREEYDAYMAC